MVDRRDAYEIPSCLPQGIQMNFRLPFKFARWFKVHVFLVRLGAERPFYILSFSVVAPLDIRLT